MRKLSLAAVVLTLLLCSSGSAQFGQPAGIFNKLVTIAAGTPVQVSTLHIVVDRFSVQALHGGTGVIYVCAGIFSGTPAAACAATANGSYELGAEVAPATTTAPGGTYSYLLDTPGLDLSTFWIDGSHTGDTALVSWHVR